MPLTTPSRNAAADGVADLITHVGLANASLTELTGGTPAYARKAITFGSASSGVAADTGSLTWDIPAGSTAAFMLFRDASTSGTDLGWAPLGGHDPKGATFLAATDVFTVPAHGYSNDDRVVVYPIQGGSLPTGFTAGTLYYVVNASTDTFQLSATSGGSAITSSDSRSVWAQKCTPEVFGAQGTLTIASGNIKVDARLA